MIKPEAPIAALVGRWGLATALVIGAVLIGRIIRDMPYLLPNRLPGLVLYELGPGLILALSIGTATNITHGRPRPIIRLFLFLLVAVVVGVVSLAVTYAAPLQGQWL